MNIDFGAISEIARKGIRRAAVFLGLGINAAESPGLRNYSLAHHSSYQFVPQEVDDATIDTWKEEFRSWIVTSGLRELIETFAVFLDKIQEACLVIALSKSRVSGKQAEGDARSFQHKGIRDKLSVLASEFAIAPDHPDALTTINQARNCLAHRRGIVGSQDCNDGDALTIRWWSIEIYFETPQGEKTLTDMPVTIPVEGPTGAGVKVGSTERVRTFSKGAVVKFTPKELHEICWFLYFSTDQIRDSAAKYAEKFGIPKAPTKENSA